MPPVCGHRKVCPPKNFHPLTARLKRTVHFRDFINFRQLKPLEIPMSPCSLSCTHKGKKLVYFFLPNLRLKRPNWTVKNVRKIYGIPSFVRHPCIGALYTYGRYCKAGNIRVYEIVANFLWIREKFLWQNVVIWHFSWDCPVAKAAISRNFHYVKISCFTVPCHRQL